MTFIMDDDLFLLYSPLLLFTPLYSPSLPFTPIHSPSLPFARRAAFCLFPAPIPHSHSLCADFSPISAQTRGICAFRARPDLV